MHIKTNPDKEYVREVRKRLKANNNYCPCKLVKTPETKCMCKEFSDMCERGESGMCACGLYIVEQD